ncbi:subtilisin-like protein [Multifurca ochricompacta]|uniref:tripeptidyl-peptidase II n=1 Tax=Multifurca ochricompacta TaxID=376703 RepID=A0AAD4MAM1_9AGAM|nr:subtilisin-like protein [Multifurca ochricompacta]
MRRLFQILALCSIALAAPSQRANHVLHEWRAAEPVGWVKSRRAEVEGIIPLRIGMKQQNIHMLEDLIMDVSHPDSPSYGQHWTPERVVDFFAPSESTVSAIRRWLAVAGFAEDQLRLSPNKGWIELNATVAEAEWLLDTEYHVYEHPSGEKQLGCHSYSVPEHISEHVEIIRPTVHFNSLVPEDPTRLHKRANPNHLGQPSSIYGPKTNGVKVETKPSLANCDQFITPDCLRALYNFHYTPKATAKNSYGIVEFTPQAFLAPDLDLFFQNFSSTQVGQRPILVSIDGGVVQTIAQSFSFNGESDLDLEYAMALTNPQPITLLQTGDLVEGAGFDNWLDAVDGSFCTFEGGDDPTQDGIYPDPLAGGFNQSESCGIIKPPFVVSVSYGQDEGTATHRYATRQCNEYGKLGLLGTTVLYSSGDNGVAGFGGVCQNSSGLDDPGGGLNEIRFNPGFPGSCSYVVSVGATQINSGASVNDPESACERIIFSGGGFSDIFPMPSYQEAVVTNFLKEHPPPYSAAQFNNSGKARGFPDLSANGANYVIAIDGLFELVFGTSASSPVVGSMITMINDARLAVGKRPVGFINPAIYSPKFAHAFNDITTGNNPGCTTDGFTAVKGWDPVTGVGTPKFDKLLPLFLGLP